nr:putative transcriptional regulator [uncultured Mediterranean phage uvMED]
MKQKYDPHIRVRFDLFDDPQFRTIPNKHKAHCLCVLICLLKFVNNKTLQCYPRKATISSMTGLSYSTIYRATVWLIRAKIVSKKRLPSTLLYTINSKYIVGYRESGHIDNRISQRERTELSAGSLLIEHNINLSNITNLIKEVADKGGDQSKIVSVLSSTLPRKTLIKAIEDKDNPYYCNMALKEQDRNSAKLVDIPRSIVDNVRKKTHFGYQQVIRKKKDLNDRKNKSKDLLRSHSKDKW